MREFSRDEHTGRRSAGFLSGSSGGNRFFQAKAEETVNETPKTGCEGWERDPQSFCIAVGRRFLADQFNLSPAAERVEVADDGGCRVFYEGGIVLTVQRTEGQEVMVYVSPLSTSKKTGTRVCRYNYSCNVSGKLELVQISCTGRGK